MKMDNEILNIVGVHDASACYILAEKLAQKPGTHLVVCASGDVASRVSDDLEFFLPLLSSTPTRVVFFPGWEISPYRKLNPSVSTRQQRLRAVSQLARREEESLIVVASVQALAQRTIDKSFLAENTFTMQKGAHFDLAELKLKLEGMGYQKVEPAEDPGAYSLRGGVIDVFSPSNRWPVRADFFDVEIDSLRFYNPATQKSIESSANETATVIPVREFNCSFANLDKARGRIKEWADSHGIPKSARDRFCEPFTDGIALAQLDYILPFLQDHACFLWDYIEPGSQIIWIEPAQSKLEFEKFWEAQVKGYEKCLENHEIAAPVEDLFANWDKLEASVSKTIQLTSLESVGLIGNVQRYSTAANSAVRPKNSANLDWILGYIRTHLDEQFKVFFVANSQSQLDRFAFLLSQKGVRTHTIDPKTGVTAQSADTGAVNLLHGSISAGFKIPDARVVFLSEDEIFGQKQHTRTSSAKGFSSTRLDDLQSDDFVVHVDHGIGRYRGLVKLSPGGVPNDFVHVEYAGADKLYLPIYRLDLIQKYIAAGSGNPGLDKLGSQHFQKVKEKAKEAAKDVAANLLRIYAQRAMKEGYAFSPPDDTYRAFEATFPYDETPDQQKAIQDTLDDMCAPRPMDRLVCGDVGFGKTEVAIRAAFKACQDSKQVAVLVPTTILAEQHYQTFSNRFKDYPFRVACLSRFRSRKEQKEILDEVKEGKVDVVVGTHRLLSKDVVFHDLGLMVVDEEQRFGVEHKEKLKEFKASTDVLTLTATPIPRTLHMSLMGMRDISIIHTPPVDRLSIRSYTAHFDRETVKTAIEQELARGGQVYFIHNRVHNLPTIFRSLSEMVPEAKIGVAHGQMPSEELEKVMLGFYQKAFDVLLCTSIIENGLDVPNANTILINRADTFGLSQLYQIRGRVGRSQMRAYCYFLVPEETTITDEAQERLRVLQRFVELGSGFSIASHDLELRGGGDILGDSQSGHIAHIGYDMYLELLQEEILRLKGEEKSTKKKEDVEISSPFATILPDDYVVDMRSRLNLYKRLSGLETEEGVEDLYRELKDRYGPAPHETNELFWLIKVKILLRRLGFRALSIGGKAIALTAGANVTDVDPAKVLSLVQKEPKKFSLSKDSKLTIAGEYKTMQDAYNTLRGVIQSITGL